jgi:hypothetical protein
MYRLRLTDMPPAKGTNAPLAHTNSNQQSGAAMLANNSLSAPRTMRTMPNSSTFKPSDELTSYATHSNNDMPASEQNMIDNMIDNRPAQQRSLVTFQADQNALDIMQPHHIQHRDSSTVASHLRASKVTYGDLNARFVAADEERSRISQLMETAKLDEERNRLSSLKTAKLLAKAESKELYARRLRESIARLDQQHLSDGPEMLRLTASSHEAQQQVDGAVELDGGHTANQMSSTSVVSQDAFNASSRSRELQPAQTEQHSSTIHAEDSGDEETEQQSASPVTPTKWQPHAISQLPPLPISSQNKETFTWEELHAHLGGAQYSPGLYFSRNSSSTRVLQGRTYWLLEAQFEPFIPSTPGQHGAKLTAFFNDSLTPDGACLDEEDYTDVPVFVCLREGEGYTYLGQYSQKRYSDKLSHSELFQHVPSSILEYWASQLASPHRPAWITEALIAHFWPQPTYCGPIPSDSAVTTPGTGVTEPQDPERVLEKRVLRALERYAVELKEWKKESRVKVTFLTEEALMEMWQKSDMDEEKGLRLWWEYLECVGFDDSFYRKLVDLKSKGLQRVSSKSSASAPVAKVNNSAEQKTAGDAEKSLKHSKHRHDSVTGPASTSTVKEATSTRQSSKRPAVISLPPPAFPQADLQAAREMHDQATKAKASERKSRGRSEKPRAW